MVTFKSKVNGVSKDLSQAYWLHRYPRLLRELTGIYATECDNSPGLIQCIPVRRSRLHIRGRRTIRTSFYPDLLSPINRNGVAG